VIVAGHIETTLWKFEFTCHWWSRYCGRWFDCGLRNQRSALRSARDHLLD